MCAESKIRGEELAPLLGNIMYKLGRVFDFDAFVTMVTGRSERIF
jgi:hypothetical protein